MPSIMFLIQGLFFTKDYIMRIGLDAEIGERVLLQPAMFRTMFSGIIKLPKDSIGGEGALMDVFGNSILTEVNLSDESFSFVKKYDRRNDIIQYKFQREGEFWVGNYSGPAVGKGAVRCILLPINKTFFGPKGLEKYFN
jgi:hypothetical protein